jgi:hypothetical protein
MLSTVRIRVFVAFIAVVVSVVALGLFGSVGKARTGVAVPAVVDPSLAVVPAITATQSDVLITDADGDGRTDPGDTLGYTVTIMNSGTDAMNSVFTGVLDGNTTLVPGSVNAGPIATNDAYGVYGNVNISISDGAGDLLGNDVDPMTGNNTGLTITTTGTFSSSNCAGCNNVSINANGSFTYDPPVGFTGADTFTYTVSEAGGLTSTATVTLNISGMIWFINNTASVCTTLAAQCGKLSKPFSSLDSFRAVNAGGAGQPNTNHNIFIYESPTTYPLASNMTLLSGQRFVGQDTAPTGTAINDAALFNLALPTGSATLPSTNTGGNSVQVTTAGIGAGSSNWIRGMQIHTTGANTKIFGMGFGSLLITEVTLSGTGKALDLSNGSFAPGSAFTSVATTSSATHGMQLINVSGTVAFGSTTVSNSTNQGIFVNASNANINFGNTSVTTTGGSTEGVRLEANTGGTRTFGTLSITNPTAQGITISGGGNVNVTGLTTITDPGTVGILINSTTAGSTATFANCSVTGSGGTGVSLTSNAGSVTFADLDISPDANQLGISLSGNTANTTTTSGTIAVTGASAISASTSPLAMIFDSVSASGGTTAGVSLTTTTGSIVMNGGTLAGNATGRTFHVNGGTVSATYKGEITQSNSADMILINGGHNTGTVTFDTGTLSATGGTGLQFNDADGTYNFNGTTTLNGGDAGIDIITGSTGTFNFGSGTSITNPSGIAYRENASTPTVNYGGTITRIGGFSAVSITAKGSGSTTFSGAITASAGVGNAIQLTNSGTVTFRGGLALTTTSCAAFNATGGGTINVCDENPCNPAATGTLANTISTNNGTGLNVNSTTIGSNNLEFRSISTGAGGTGPMNGIILNTTGASGRLIVTGNGGSCTSTATCSGGAIQNTVSHGVLITNTLSPTFTRMAIENTGGSGIEGTRVTNFTLQNSFINISGTAGDPDDSNVAFNATLNSGNANLTGTVSITDNILNRARYHGVDIQQDTGTLSDILVSGNSFTSDMSVTTSLGSAVRIIALGNSGATTVANVTKATLSNNNITNFNTGAGFVLQGGNSQDTAGAPSGTFGDPTSPTNLIAVTNNLMNGGTLGVGNQPDRFVTAAINGRGQGHFDISNNGTVANPIKNIDGVVIELSAFGQTTVRSHINGNRLTSNNAVGSAGIGVGCDADSLTTTTDNALLTTFIDGNNISLNDGPDIYTLARGTSTCTLNATITNNTLAAPNTTTSARAGVRVDSGSTGSNNTVCLDIAGNNTAGSTNTATSTTSPGINLRRQTTGTNVFGIKGMAATASPGVETFVNGQNTSTSGTFGVAGTALLSGTSGFSNCSTSPTSLNLSDSNRINHLAHLAEPTYPAFTDVTNLFVANRWKAHKLLNKAPVLKSSESKTNPAEIINSWESDSETSESDSKTLVRNNKTSELESKTLVRNNNSQELFNYSSENKRNPSEMFNYSSEYKGNSSEIFNYSSENKRNPSEIFNYSWENKRNSSEIFGYSSESESHSAELSVNPSEQDDNTEGSETAAERYSLVQTVFEVVSRVGAMISPTVYSQEVLTGEKSANTTEITAPNVTLAGETIVVDGGSASGFTIPAGGTLTISFRATANAYVPGTAAYTSVSSQGTVSGTGFSTVTDDPDVMGANQPTVTNVDHTTVSVASDTNPSVLGDTVTFTATLTGVPTRASDPPGTVQFKADGMNIGAAVAVTVGTLNNNVSTATVGISSLSVGNHVITAEYSGGGSGSTQYNANTGTLTPSQTVNATAGAGAITVKSAYNSGIPGNQTFTLKKEFYISANCTTGSLGAATNNNGVNSTTGVTISRPAGANSVKLTAPAASETVKTSDQNGNWTQWTTLATDTPNTPPTPEAFENQRVCVNYADVPTTRTYFARFGDGIQTLAADCTTPKSIYNLGETVCTRLFFDPAAVSGNQLKTWLAGPDNVARNCPAGNCNDPSLNVPADQGTYSFVLPMTNAGNLGMWEAIGLDQTSSPTTRVKFSVQNNAPLAGSLWYNGNFDGVNGSPNEINPSVPGNSYTFTDFNVTDPGGWNVTGLYSNNLMESSFTATTAAYEIRSGVSSGNAGTLVFSGTAPATKTLTGRSGVGLDEYTVLISGLNIHLDPGTYHLSVTPIGPGSGRSYNSTTSGANAVGTPAGNNGNDFLRSVIFSSNYAPTTHPDHSNGVIGTVAAPPVVLWYNGDFDTVNGQPNEINSQIPGDSFTFTDFNVTDPGGWDVTAIFSNNEMSYTSTMAAYEIRSGISNGNAGTLLFSGTAPATRVATGRMGVVDPEYTIKISGLNIHLAPGTYFLNVTPIGPGSGRSFNTTTSGANAIGTPAGNNGNDFARSVPFSANYAPTNHPDHSSGVIGTVGVAPPSIAKAFSPSTTAVGSTSTLTFTITNPAANTVPLTGVTFTDTFPNAPNLIIANPPTPVLTGCGAGVLTDNTGGALVANDLGVRLTGATVAVGTPCTVSVNVTPLANGPFVNISGNVSSTNGGTGNTATATLSTNAAPVITAPANQSANEGASTAINLGSFADSTFGPWAVVVNWGDGSPNTTFNTAAAGSLGASNHTFADGPGVYTVSVQVTDSGTLSDSKTFTVTVSNVQPTASFGNGGPYVFGQNGQVAFSGQTDPSTVDTAAGFRYGYDLGNDGSYEAGGGTYASGTSSATTAFAGLPVGSHTVRGRIIDKDGGSTDYTTTLVVDKASTTTVLTSSTNPTVFGQNTTFTATVTVDVPGSGTPTGNVSFRDNLVNIGTCAAEAVTANIATCSINLLSVGTHPITAVYNGDSNFNGSTSNSVDQVVNKVDTTTTITGDNPDPSVFGQNYTVAFTVAVAAPGLGTPTGNVTVSDGTNTCAATVAAGSCQLPSTSVGTKSLTATYSGDSNANGSVSAAAPHQVIKADSNVTVQTTINPPTYGQVLTMTASLTAVSPGIGVPQGVVNFTDGGAAIADCQNVAVNAFGSATCATNTLPAGVNKLIAANYSGDADFNSSSGSTTQNINKATLNITASSHTVTYGDAAPVITSTITDFVLGENSSALSTQPTCSTTYTQGAGAVNSPYPTSCTAAAAANYQFNYIGGTVLVNKKTLDFTAENKSRGYGTANPALTFTTSGLIAGDNLANSTTGSPGLSTSATATSPVGTYPIEITAGNLASTNYSFGTFTNGTLTVGTSQLTVTAEDKTRTFGAANPALTFTVTGFTNGEGTSVLTGAPTLSTTAIATSAPGAYPITITHGTLANSNYTFAFVNGTMTVTGGAATTTTITNAASLAANATPVGQAYAVNWSVQPVPPAAGTPTGNVTVSDGTGATCTASAATGTCNLTSTTLGAKTITATYSGDANFAGSSATAATTTIVIAFTGNVKQFVAFGTNTNLDGVTVTLTNTTTNQSTNTTTDASGNYSFGMLTLGQSYTITPTGLGKVYEATNRTYTNVNTNVTGADFIAYDVPGPNAIPRTARITSQATTPGTPVTIPVLMTTTGVETRVAFTIEYSVGTVGIPTVSCGTGAVGCELTIDNSLPGRAGITIIPAGPLAAGTVNVANVSFATFPTNLTGTPIRFGDFPTARNVRNAENNPLPVLYWTDGQISFTGGTLTEGASIAGRVTTPNGQGLRNATVVLIDTVGNRWTTQTSSFGNYTFPGLQLGRDYMVTVQSRRYRFSPRVLLLTEAATGFDLYGIE